MKLKTIFLFALTIFSCTAHAEDIKEVIITVNDGYFKPDQIKLPANVKFRLIVKNEGKTAEEFESNELNQERLIPPNQSRKFLIGPLSKGEYKFFGEFHEKTAQGKIIIE